MLRRKKMKPIFIAIIIVLCQYPIAMLTLMKMFACKLEKTQSIVWNFVIILVPFAGAATFWIYYAICKKQIDKNRAIYEEKLKNRPVLLSQTKDEDVAAVADANNATDNEDAPESSDDNPQ